jgi:arylsulfatase A-like enzyme
MDRRQALTLIGRALSSVSLSRLSAALPSLARGRRSARAKGPPNVVFIMTDDQRQDAMGAYGNTILKTPNMDRIAAGGVRFTEAFVTNSLCGPSRASVLTGLYSHAHGVITNGGGPEFYNQPGLRDDQVTFVHLLRQAGYHTALVGKWHLGFAPEFSPLRHGFDEFFGIKGGGADYFTHKGRRGVHELYEGDVTADRVGYLTDLLSGRAVEFISRPRVNPFYLSLHYTAPHWPWEGPADTHPPASRVPDSLPHSFSDGGSQTIFREMMKSLDDGVGRVMRALAAAGRDRDTLVIFTSDNGGERYSYNWPWSNGKFTLYEGGIRVPLALRWPGTIRAGTSCDQLAISMDWTATLVAAAGARVDQLDGTDLLPCARGGASTERTLFWRQPDPIVAPHAAVRQGKWKYLRAGTNEQLFDLDADPGEKSDQKARRPDILADLRDRWNRWNSEMVPMRTETTPP